MKPYNEDQRPKGEQVRDMFDGIAPVYDLLNDVLSLGIARHWRRVVVRRVAEHVARLGEAEHAADVCTKKGEAGTPPAEGVCGDNVCSGRAFTEVPSGDAATPGGEPHIIASLNAVIAAGTPETRILDLATGTGDLALALARRLPDVRITAADPSDGMLTLARKKAAAQRVPSAPRGASPAAAPCGGRYAKVQSPYTGGVPATSVAMAVNFVVASAEQLPFDDGEFDAVTVSFGVRNFSDIEGSLCEIRRVLKPGGALFVLEFSTPRNRLWGAIYRFYFHKILPRIGALLSRDNRAYTYLPSSVDEFPTPARFVQMLTAAGFAPALARPLTGGVAYIYKAEVLREQQ